MQSIVSHPHESIPGGCFAVFVARGVQRGGRLAHVAGLFMTILQYQCWAGDRQPTMCTV